MRWLISIPIATGAVLVGLAGATNGEETIDLLLATPALGFDSDLDGVGGPEDNCSEAPNPQQDDTDGDDCGNLCDANYDQGGTVGFGDFGFSLQCFGTTNELCQHVEPIGGGRTAGFADFGFFTSNFGTNPGPSGTTAGTTACP